MLVVSYVDYFQIFNIYTELASESPLVRYLNVTAVLLL